MTNKQILEKAIQKAIDGGWSGFFGDFKYVEPNIVTEELLAFWQFGNLQPYGYSIAIIIFSHDFAKALWGEELTHETFIVPKELNKRFSGTKLLDIKPAWQYHLQRMVIAEDPIKYLAEHLEG